MATIQTAIEMKDGVSSKLDKMAQSADGLGKKVAGAANAIEKTAQSAKNVAGSTEVAVNATKQYASATDSVTKATNGMASATKNTDEAMKKLSASVGGMYYRLFNMPPLLDYIKATASSAFGQFTLANMASSYIQKLAAAIAEIPSELIKMSDSYIGTLARIKLATSSQEEAVQMNEAIYQSALRARGSYSQMASNIAQVALIAKSAFPDPNEVVPFMEGIQKLFVINGTDSISQGYAMLQLKQALSAGKLQGDEFRSIAEAAPLIETMIADYLKVPQGALKKMGSDGLLTAEIVKNAILSQMDIINAKFETIPKRWMDLWQNVKTRAFKAFTPVLLLLNELANTKMGTLFPTLMVDTVTALANGLAVVLSILVWISNSPITENLLAGLQALHILVSVIFDALYNGVMSYINAIGSVVGPIFAGIGGVIQWLGSVLSTNLGIAEPLITALALIGSYYLAMGIKAAIGYGIAAAGAMAHALASMWETAQILYLIVAQEGLNAALYACPITWIIGLVVLLVVAFYAVIAVVNHFAGTTISATALIAYIFAWLFTGIINGIKGIANNFIAFANFLGSAFVHPLDATYNLFVDIWNGIVDLVAVAINGIIDMIKEIPGIDKAADKLGISLDYVTGASIKADRKEINNALWHINPLEYGDMGYNARYARDTFYGLKLPSLDLGKTLEYSDASSTPGTTDENGKKTADNTGRMANSLDNLEEDIQAMKSFAEQEALMYYTRQEINLGDINTAVTNNNGMDIDGVITHITGSLYEQLASSAEAVHV